MRWTKWNVLKSIQMKHQLRRQSLENCRGIRRSPSATRQMLALCGVFAHLRARHTRGLSRRWPNHCI